MAVQRFTPKRIGTRRRLHLSPPLLPMEALSVEAIPEGPGWQYEPKWDGFRCLAFRNGDSIELQSKSGQSLTRYFPEIVAALKDVNVNQFVLDGELAIPIGQKLSFDDLLLRLHPAASRVEKLSKQTPAIMIVFDLLGNTSGESLIDETLRDRRTALQAFATKYLRGNERIRLSPATTDAAQARKWFRSVGAALDGVIAKRIDLPYQSGNRTGM